MEVSKKVEDRIRLNIKTSAKGQGQLDITVETNEMQHAGELLETAIETAKEVCTKQGITLIIS